MLQETIAKLIDRTDLRFQEARGAVEAIMAGQCTDVQIAAFLVALRMKGETADEIAGAASVMREKVTPIESPGPGVLDTCGTGGDGLGTFNISTATAIVAAGAGVVVAKHGNRRVSSTSGSADVLQELGVNVEADVATVNACIRDVGIGFCFAPLLHEAMRHVMPVRKALAVRTLFNVLGPLTNPAGADCQLLGVGDPGLPDRLAAALRVLGTRRALVVHGEDGQDEVTLAGATHVWEVAGDQVRRHQWQPADFGLPACRVDELVVDSPSASAAVITGVLGGRSGPARDTVLANVAAALVAAERVDGLAAGVAMAAEAIDTGRAKDVLARLCRASHEVPSA